MSVSTRSRATVLTWALALGLGVGAAAGAKRPRKIRGELGEALDLARRTLAFVQRTAPRAKLAAKLAALERQAVLAGAIGPAERDRLAADVRQLRRRIIFSHPALDFEKLLINKRSCSIPGHMCDQYLGRHSGSSPGLAVLTSWKESPKETLLTADKLPAGNTMHPDLSFDARRVLFGFCDHSVTRDRKQRSYFIYELDLAAGEVRQLTGTAKDRWVGTRGRQTVLIEDFDPCYLPGGGFAFISTRSQQFGRCHGSRYVPSYILFRADADGSNIRQVSFNEANEWDPAVLHDGRLIYCRWDYINRHDTNFQSLWVTRPDGTVTGHFYGNYSVGPCMIAEPRAIPGSHKVVATATDHHGYTSGSIIVIDPYKGEDGGEPLLAVTPEIGFPERRAPQGTTMAPRPAPSSRKRSGRGRKRAATPFPLSEDLFLVAYPHESRFAVYLIDTLGGRELIHADPKWSCFAPIPLRPVSEPPVIPDTVVGRTSRTGRFYIQDVYQSSQPIERGTIKALRVSEIISQPTRSKPVLSYVNNEIIKRILGTVPVAADGSTSFEVPADTPLQFQLLDENGMAVMTMRSLVYARPGELAGCVGCHEPRHATPLPPAPPAPMAFPPLKPPHGPRYPGGFSFARTVQPVLDRHCIGCHGLKNAAGGVNLLGTFGDSGGRRRRGRFSAAYESLMRRGMVVIAQRNSESAYSRPKDYFAHAGKLAKMLLKGHPDKAGKPRVRLDRPSFQRIVDWLDLNAQFYGDYSFNRAENRRIDPAGEKALRAFVAERFGQEMGEQPYAALVNVTMPTESRILKAPLAAKAGGWGQVTRGAYPSTDDAGYRKMLKLVAGSIRPQEHHDIAGTCGRPAGRGCRCGCCWVRQVRETRRKTGAVASR